MEDKKKSIISQETLIPLGLLIIMSGVAISAIWFMATMSSNVTNNSYRIEKVENKLENVATKDDLNMLEKNLREIFQKN